MDWNLGVNYAYLGDNIGIQAGIGAYHFTHPKMALITPDKDTGLRGRLVFHGKININVSPNRALVFNNVFWSEGLYWKSTALDLYTLVANWSGAEFVKTNISDDKFSMNYGLYTRSFKTVMPYLSLYPGRGINLRISYEFPIAFQLFQSYTAKRFELALHYTPSNWGRESGSRTGRQSSPESQRGYLNYNERSAKANSNATAKPVDTLPKPPAAPVGDRDGDGVTDLIDKCPDQAGPLTNQGCPLLDRDGDGINDTVDKCPDQAGPLSNQGCPLLDRDGDGINDVLDKCPDQAGPADNMGCPNFMKNSSNQSIDNSEDYYLSMTNANFVQKDTIQFYTFFDLNSARLTQNSFVLLNKVVDFLKRNNEYRCLIAGHSDIEGDIEANMKISEKRANIVKSYISSYGIADVRLQTSFYGKSQPLPIYDKNLKWMNRRVEVLLMKVK